MRYRVYLTTGAVLEIEGYIKDYIDPKSEYIFFDDDDDCRMIASFPFHSVQRIVAQEEKIKVLEDV